MLEERGACVLAAELAADEASVDRLTEHRRLPEREPLEPRERLDARGRCVSRTARRAARVWGNPASPVTGDDPSALARPFGSV